MEYFDEAKRAVASAIRDAMKAKSLAFSSVSQGLGADAASRLAEFSLRGKMLRGCLVRLGYDLARGANASGGAPEPASESAAVSQAGAAMELFQSGLLAHDDIMDRDRVRRGSPTMHVAYEKALERGGYEDPGHHGEALGICAGDLAYFAAFQLLTELPLEGSTAARAAGLAAGELCSVGIAQMQDVVNGAVGSGAAAAFGSRSVDPSEEDILALYRYKTGRYTFSLPLALGCVIAGGTDEARLALETAGEELGILFQLKDDELGLFADEAALGKPVGADIRENKKTIYRKRLLERADEGLRMRLLAAFGDKASGESESALVRGELERLGIRAELSAMMEGLARASIERVGPLLDKAPEHASRAFRQLVAYSLERRS